MLHNTILTLIGNTPMLELTRFAEGCRAKVLAKLEYFNPAGSVKDRAAFRMIEDAEVQGLICPGDTLIEPTSGNTGIGIAMIAACKGYRVILTMPDTMSVERRKLLQAYGAELVLTDGAKGMQGAIDAADALAAEIPGAYIFGQFSNPSNARAHYLTTGPEIYSQTQEAVDIFVSCVGTGGTITGTGRYLKERKPHTRIVAVEPYASRVLSGGKPGPHKLQGIGAGFIPDVLDTALIDEIIPVRDEDAFLAARTAVRKEGILVGITSGAALYAALQLAGREENTGKTIVALLPDTGERYLSSELFE